MFQSDHRPYYVDLDAKIAFADQAYEIARPKGRGLQLHDPRLVMKYKEQLYEQYEYHNIIKKVEQLITKSAEGSWSIYLSEEYQKVDKLITEAMIYAERKTGRKYSTKFDWSPALKQAVQAFRFWKMKLKLSKGLHVSPTVLQHYHSEAALPLSNLSEDFSETQLIQAIKAAYHTMVSHQKNHPQLRQSYLEGLAEAIVLHQSPTLSSPEATHIRAERTSKQLKNLIRREKHKKMYNKIGHTLVPHQSKGLERIDIPDSRAKGGN